MVGSIAILRIALCVAFALALASCGGDDDSEGASGDTTEQGESAEPVKLGVVIPLTGSLAQPGEWIETALRFAVDEVNEVGGINGGEVELTIYDDAADPTQVVTQVNRLINQDEVDFIIGPITTDGMKAALPVETQANIASIGVVGSPSLTPDVMPYGFSVLLNAGDQATKMVERAAGEGYESVAILHDSGEQGRTANIVLEEQVQAQGIELTGTQQYEVGATDMTAQLLSLQRGNPQALLLYPTTGEDVGNVLVGMKQLGWDVPVVGGYAAHFSDAIASVAGEEELERLTATAYAPFGACPGEGVPETTQAFIDAIEQFDPDVFENLSLDLAAASRDAVWIAKAAIEGAGTTDGDAVASWLEENSASLGDDLVNQGVAASPESHFLFGPDAMVLVSPAEQVERGIYTRTDC